MSMSSNLAKAKLLAACLATDKEAEDGALLHPQSVWIAALVFVDLGYILLITIKSVDLFNTKNSMWTYFVIATHFWFSHLMSRHNVVEFVLKKQH